MCFFLFSLLFIPVSSTHCVHLHDVVKTRAPALSPNTWNMLHGIPSSTNDLRFHRGPIMSVATPAVEHRPAGYLVGRDSIAHEWSSCPSRPNHVWGHSSGGTSTGRVPWREGLHRPRTIFVSIVAQPCRKPSQRWNLDRQGSLTGLRVLGFWAWGFRIEGQKLFKVLHNAIPCTMFRCVNMWYWGDNWKKTTFRICRAWWVWGFGVERLWSRIRSYAKYSTVLYPAQCFVVWIYDVGQKLKKNSVGSWTFFDLPLFIKL